jgi:colanic acid/amylovoran biosynthesis glycosyltransferase
MTRKVALFCTNFLPYSQTFVHEELRAHTRYEAEVFAWRRQNATRFLYPRVHVANALYGGTLASPRFARRIVRGGFSLAHAHFGPGAIYALPYVGLADLPLVVTFHGYDVPLLWNTRRLQPEFWPYALLGARMLSRMTLGLCASTDLLELLVEHGVPRQKLRLHRLGIDVDTWHSAAEHKDGFEVLMVGRFVAKKGFSYGIRAFAELLREHPGARLVVVGDGPLEPRLRALVAELGIGGSVRFTGAVPNAEVVRLVRASSVLLAPSVVDRDGDRESGLIVAKEAGAASVPVVATVHGGLPEIIEHGVTGLLAQERDVAGLARHLGALAASPTLRAAMGMNAARKMRAEYDNRDRVRALEGLYDEAIMRHGAS